MDFLRKPWAHQLEAFTRARALRLTEPDYPGFALLFDPGCGKSATAINIWRDVCNSKKVFQRTLIFCPPIVIKNWKDEFRLNSKIDPDQITLLTGSGKRREKLFWEKACPQGVSGPRSPHIFVTNYESLLMDELYAAMKIWQPEVVIFDEAHKLKNSSAKRSKLAERLVNGGPTIPYRLLLTGSPVLKDLMDHFHQFLVLDGGRTFGRNFFIFRARYFRDRNASMPKQKYFPDWRVMTLDKEGYDGESEINKQIAAHAAVAKKSECLDLPPFVQQTITVPMAPEQKRLYEEMRKDFITVVNDKACTAQLAITKAMRLQQIASGFVKVVDGEEIPVGENPKQEALKELLEKITPHSKVLVWAVWKQNYSQIREVCDALGVGYVEIHGDITPAKKNLAVERLNTDPSVRVLIGHPGSGGIGVNLVAASYSIFYSRTFSLEHHLQAEARNYRGGSEIHEKITRYDLVCENTIEEIVQKKLAQKIEMSDKLIKDIAVELSKG